MSESVQVVTDLDIPTLPAVLDPAELARRLQMSSFPPAHLGRFESVEVRLLTHHPGSRCTVEITLETKDGWRHLIGKVYAVDRSDIFYAMQTIQKGGFGPEAEFSIPQPVAYIPALRLLLQEKVQGPQVKDVLLNGNEEDRAEAAQRSAQWLARFHAAAPPSGPIFGLARHMHAIRRWSRLIVQQDDPLAGKARRLLEWLEDRAAALGSMEMCAGHGSYSPTHVILAPGRTVTFDWDGHGTTEPTRDVARFIIALRRLAHARLRCIRALDAAAEVFLKTYLAAGRPGVLERLPFYEAAVCLQFADYSIVHPVNRWREKAEAMLEEGLRIMEH